ncbi:MAG TPA: hypothetical protein VN814_16280 [Caulobacteraceae bacterium]|nr:hypothetical protein [Caulobacteraceae bacterium]
MILRIVLPLALLAAFSLQAGSARASGDFTCTPAWKLDKTIYSDCDNLPFLSPGNDSRVNLALLLVDAGQAQLGPPPQTDPPQTELPTTPISDSAGPFTLEAFSALIGPRAPGALKDADSSPDYASGEGSRCRSLADGAAAFAAALGASAVPEAEGAILTGARNALSPDCNAATPSAAYAPPQGVRSPLGRQFARYLAGTAEFYGGDYDDAGKDFAAAAASPQPWLKETATYMLGRVALNQAQWDAFDEYGLLSPDKVDAAALKEADAAFQAYLAAYPAGQYAASARGLLRRVAWLGGQPQKLAAAYAWSFAHAGPAERNVAIADLVLEADDKLLTKAAAADISEPTLLATRDLMVMRHDPADPKPNPSLIKFEDLLAQRPAFAGRPDLFEYLLAAHRFYVEADPAGALSHLGVAPPAGPMTDLGFSQLVLRGLALEAQKNFAGARLLWRQMIPLARPAFQRPMLDLALAMNQERDGRLAQVFAAASPVRDPQVRETLLRNDAGPALLAQQVKAETAPGRERRTARYVLLYKDVMRGRYGAFASDAALAVPKAEAPPNPDDPEPDPKLFEWSGHAEGYLCEDLRKLVKALAGAPRSSHNLLCLGDFARLNGLDGNALNASAPADELGGAPTQFPGQTFGRLDAYKLIIADPKAPANDRAYALYRAINCFGPSGYNRCDGKDAPQSERARWFHTLKSDYPKSEWASALKYYW